MNRVILGLAVAAIALTAAGTAEAGCHKQPYRPHYPYPQYPAVKVVRTVPVQPVKVIVVKRPTVKVIQNVETIPVPGTVPGTVPGETAKLPGQPTPTPEPTPTGPVADGVKLEPNPNYGAEGIPVPTSPPPPAQ